MGGKGQRRREKNYLSAHGGDSRLPPPPKLKELDALPSKLRKLMQFKNIPGVFDKKRNGDNADDKKANPKVLLSSAKVVMGKEISLRKTSVENLEDKDGTMDSSTNDAKKKKRKRKTVEDLRFLALDQAAGISKRKQRKKEYLEAKKKKKQKKDKTDEIRSFPGQEKVMFGDIVQAPPKLTLPKLPKSVMDASKERARLEAVDAYRNRKGWTSRPGIKLPCPAETQAS